MFHFPAAYEYARDRSDFGRPVNFKTVGPNVVCDIEPDKSLITRFIRKNPIADSTQIYRYFSRHEVMTYKTPYRRRNDNQCDTGWPKEVLVSDPEQTMRFRKKQEKDERLVALLPTFQKRITMFLALNNAMDVYGEVFEDPEIEEQPDFGTFDMKTLNVFRPTRDPRASYLPVSTISWSEFDGGDKVAIACADFTFQKPSTLPNHSFVWSMGNQISPMAVLRSSFPCTVLEFCDKDPQCIAAGFYNGQVGYYDLRQGYSPVDLSPLYTSFRDPVTCVLWTSSKTGTEFYSCSTDGQIIWWDIRNLEEPVESVLFDFTKGEEQAFNRAVGISSNEFEPTIPTRFMIGAENGRVYSGNRKGKTLTEKITHSFAAHHGPVRSVQRNPCFLKNFITAGDWTVRIWSDDCKESSIVWTFYHSCELTKACWSPVKPSVFFATRTDGVIDVWDFILNQEKPVYSMKVADVKLTALRVHESGQMLAVGDEMGRTYVLELSKFFYHVDKTDKIMVAALFERESRREKIIEVKVREAKLKAQQRPAEEVVATDSEKQMELDKCTEDFYATIALIEAGGKLKPTEDEYD